MIDGHNLIPKIPGLSLREIDDEARLLQILQVYARLKRKKVEVFFDGAPPGLAGERMVGTLRAHFVPLGHTADEAIRRRLAGMGKSARSVTVVTSDRQVQTNARALHALVRSSEDFAGDLASLPAGGPSQQAPGAGPAVQAHDVGQWLDLFGIDPTRADQPIEMTKKRPEVKKPENKKNRPHHGFSKK